MWGNLSQLVKNSLNNDSDNESLPSTPERQGRDRRRDGNLVENLQIQLSEAEKQNKSINEEFKKILKAKEHEIQRLKFENDSLSTSRLSNTSLDGGDSAVEVNENNGHPLMPPAVDETPKLHRKIEEYRMLVEQKDTSLQTTLEQLKEAEDLRDKVEAQERINTEKLMHELAGRIKAHETVQRKMEEMRHVVEEKDNAVRNMADQLAAQDDLLRAKQDSIKKLKRMAQGSEATEDMIATLQSEILQKDKALADLQEQLGKAVTGQKLLESSVSNRDELGSSKDKTIESLWAEIRQKDEVIQKLSSSKDTRLVELENKSEQMKAKMSQLESENEDFEHTIQALQKKLDLSSNKLTKLSEEHEESLLAVEGELKIKEELLKSKEQAIAMMSQDLSEKGSSSKGLLAELESVKASAVIAANEKEELSQKYAKEHEEKCEIGARWDAACEERDSLSQQLEQLQKKIQERAANVEKQDIETQALIAEHQVKSSELLTQHGQLESKVSLLETELQEYQEALANKDSSSANLMEQLEDARNVISQKSEEHAILERQLVESAAARDAAFADASTLADNEKSLKSENQTIAESLADVQEEVSNLKEQCATVTSLHQLLQEQSADQSAEKDALLMKQKEMHLALEEFVRATETRKRKSGRSSADGMDRSLVSTPDHGSTPASPNRRTMPLLNLEELITNSETGEQSPAEARSFAEIFRVLEEERCSVEDKLDAVIQERDNLLSRASTLGDEVDVERGKSSELTQRLEEGQSAISNMEADIARYQEEIQHINVAMATAEQALAEIITTKTQTEEQCARLQEQMDRKTEELDVINRDSKTLQENLAAQIERLEEQNKTLSGDFANLKQEFADKCQGSEDLLEKLSSLEKEILSKDNMLASEREASSVLKSEADVLRNDLDLKLRDCEELISAKADLEEAATVIKNELSIKDSMLSDSSAKLQQTLRLLEEIESTNTTLNERLASLDAEVDSYQAKLRSADESASTHEERNNSLVEKLQVTEAALVELEVAKGNLEDKTSELSSGLFTKENECHDLSAKLDMTIREADEKEERTKKLLEEYEALIANKDQSTGNLMEASRKEAEEMTDEIHNLRSELHEVRTKSDSERLHADEEIAQMKVAMQRANDAYLTESDALKASQENLVSLETSYRELQASKESLEADLHDKIYELDVECGRSKSQCDALHSETTELRASVEHKLTELQISKERLLEAEKTNDSILKELRETSDALEKSKESLLAKETLLAEYSERCESLNSELTSVYKRSSEMEESLEETITLLGEARKRVLDLEEAEKVALDKEAAIRAEYDECADSLNDLTAQLRTNEENITGMTQQLQNAATEIQSLALERDECKEIAARRCEELNAVGRNLEDEKCRSEESGVVVGDLRRKLKNYEEQLSVTSSESNHLIAEKNATIENLGKELDVKQGDIFALSAEFQATKETLHEAETKQLQLTDALANSELSVSNLEGHLKEKSTAEALKLSEINELRDKLSTLEESLAQKETEASNLETTSSELIVALQSKDEKLASLLEDQDHLSTTNNQLQVKLDDAKDCLRSMEEGLVREKSLLEDEAVTRQNELEQQLEQAKLQSSALEESLREERNVIETSKCELEAKLLEAETKINELEDVVSVQRSSLANLDAKVTSDCDAIESLNSELNDTREYLENSKSTSATLKEESELREARIHELEADLLHLQSTMQDLRLQFDVSRKECSEIQCKADESAVKSSEEMQHATTRFEELNNEIEALRSGKEANEQEFEQLQKKFDKKSKSFEELKAKATLKVKSLKDELALVTNEFETMKGNLEAVQNARAQLAEKHEKCLTDLSEKDSEVSSLKSSHEHALTDIETLQRQIQSLESDRQQLLQVNDSDSDRMKQIATELDSVRSSRDDVLQELVTLREEREELLNTSQHQMKSTEEATHELDSLRRLHEDTLSELNKLQQTLNANDTTAANVTRQLEETEAECMSLKEKHSLVVDELHDAQEKLLRSQDNLTDLTKQSETSVEEVRNAFTQEISSLKTAYDDVVGERDNLANEVTTHCNQIAQLELSIQDHINDMDTKDQCIQSLNVELGKLKQKTQDQIEEGKAVREMLQNALDQVQSLQHEVVSRDNEIKSFGERLHQEETSQAENAAREVEDLRQQLVTANETVSGLRGSMEMEINNRVSLGRDLEVSLNEKHALEAQVSELETVLNENQTLNAGLSEKVDSLIASLSSTESRLQETSSVNASLLEIKDDLSSEIVQLRSETEGVQLLTRGNEILMSEKEALRNELEDSRQLISQLDEMKSKLRDYVEENAKLKQEKDTLQERVSAVESLLAESDTAVKSLEENTAKLQAENSESLSAALETASKEQQQLKLKCAKLIKKCQTLKHDDENHQKTIASLQDSLNEATDQLAEGRETMATEMTSLKADMEYRSALNVADVEKIVLERDRDIESMQNELSEANAKILALASSLDQSTLEYHTASSVAGEEIQSLRSMVDQLENELKSSGDKAHKPSIVHEEPLVSIANAIAVNSEAPELVTEEIAVMSSADVAIAPVDVLPGQPESTGSDHLANGILEGENAAQLTTLIDEKEAEISRLNTSVEKNAANFEKARKRLAVMKRVEAKLGAENASLLTELESQKRVVDQLQNEKGSAETEARDVRQSASRLQDKLTELTNLFNTVESEKEALKRDFEAISREIKSVQDIKTNLQEEFDKVSHDLKARDEQCLARAREAEQFKDEAERLRGVLQQLKGELLIQEEKIQAKETAMVDMLESMQTVREEAVADLEEQLNTTIEENNQLMTRITERDEAIEKLEMATSMQANVDEREVTLLKSELDVAREERQWLTDEVETKQQRIEALEWDLGVAQDNSTASVANAEVVESLQAELVNAKNELDQLAERLISSEKRLFDCNDDWEQRMAALEHEQNLTIENEVERQLETLKRENESLVEQLSVLETESAEKVKSLSDELDAVKDQSVNQSLGNYEKKLESEKVSIEEQLRSEFTSKQETNVESVKKELDELKTHKDEIIRKLKLKLKQVIKDRDLVRGNLQAEVERLTNEKDMIFNEVQGNLQSNESKLNEVEEKLAQKEEDLHEVNQKLESLVQELDELKTRVTEDEADTSKRDSALEARLEEKCAELDKYRWDASDMEAKIEGLEMKLAAIGDDKEEIEEQLRVANEAVEVKLEELAMLKHTLAENGNATMLSESRAHSILDESDVADFEKTINDLREVVDILTASNSTMTLELSEKSELIEAVCDAFDAEPSPELVVKLITQRDQLYEEISSLREKLSRKRNTRSPVTIGNEPNAELSELAMRLEESEAESEQLENSVEELEATVKELEATVEYQEGTVRKMEAQIEQLESAVEYLEANVSDLSGELEERKTALDQMEGFLTEKTSKVEELQSALDNKEETAKEYVTETVEQPVVAMDTFEASSGNQEQREQELLQGLNNELNTLRNQFDTSVAECHQLTQRCRELESEVKEMTSHCQDLELAKAEIEATAEERKVELRRVQGDHDRVIQERMVVEEQPLTAAVDVSHSEINERIAEKNKTLKELRENFETVVNEKNHIVSQLQQRLTSLGTSKESETSEYKHAMEALRVQLSDAQDFNSVSTERITELEASLNVTRKRLDRVLDENKQIGSSLTDEFRDISAGLRQDVHLALKDKRDLEASLELDRLTLENKVVKLQDALRDSDRKATRLKTLAFEKDALIGELQVRVETASDLLSKQEYFNGLEMRTRSVEAELRMARQEQNGLIGALRGTREAHALLTNNFNALNEQMEKTTRHHAAECDQLRLEKSEYCQELRTSFDGIAAEKDTILSELRSRLLSLQRDRDDLEVRHANDIDTMKQEYAYQMDELQRRISELLDARERAIDASLNEDFQRLLQEKDDVIASKSADCARLENEATNTKVEFDRRCDEIAALKQQCGEVEEQLKTIEIENQHSSQTHAAVLEQHALDKGLEMKSLREQYDVLLNNKEANIHALNERLASIESTCNHMAAAIDSYKREKAMLEQSLSDVTLQLQLAQGEKQSIVSELGLLRQDVAAVETARSDDVSVIDGLKEALTREKTNANQLAAKISIELQKTPPLDASDLDGLLGDLIMALRQSQADLKEALGMEIEIEICTSKIHEVEQRNRSLLSERDSLEKEVVSAGLARDRAVDIARQDFEFTLKNLREDLERACDENRSLQSELFFLQKETKPHEVSVDASTGMDEAPVLSAPASPAAQKVTEEAIQQSTVIGLESSRDSVYDDMPRDGHHDNVENLTAELEKQKKAVAKMRAIAKKYKSQLDDTVVNNETAVASLSDECSRLTESCSRLSEELVIWRQDCGVKDQSLQSMREEIDALVKEKTSLVEGHRTRLEKLDAQHRKEADQTVEGLSSEIKSLRQELSSVTNDKDNLETTLEIKDGELSAVNEANTTQGMEVSELRRNVAIVTKNCNETFSKLETEIQTRRSLEERLAHVSNEFIELQQYLAAKQSRDIGTDNAAFDVALLAQREQEMADMVVSYEKAKELIETLESELSVSRETVKNLDEDKLDRERCLQDLRSEIEDMVQAKDALVSTWNERLLEVEARKEQEIEALTLRHVEDETTTRSETEQLRTSLEASLQELLTSKARVADLTSEVDELRSHLQAAESHCATLQSELQGTLSRYEEATAAYRGYQNDAEARLLQKEHDLMSLREAVANLRTEHANHLQHVDDLQSARAKENTTVEDIRALLAREQRRCKRLENDLLYATGRNRALESDSRTAAETALSNIESCNQELRLSLYKKDKELQENRVAIDQLMQEKDMLAGQLRRIATKTSAMLDYSDGLIVEKNSDAASAMEVAQLRLQLKSLVAEKDAVNLHHDQAVEQLIGELSTERRRSESSLAAQRLLQAKLYSVLKGFQSLLAELKTNQTDLRQDLVGNLDVAKQELNVAWFEIMSKLSNVVTNANEVPSATLDADVLTTPASRPSRIVSKNKRSHPAVLPVNEQSPRSSDLDNAVNLSTESRLYETEQHLADANQNIEMLQDSLRSWKERCVELEDRMKLHEHRTPNRSRELLINIDDDDDSPTIASARTGFGANVKRLVAYGASGIKSKTRSLTPLHLFSGGRSFASSLQIPPAKKLLFMTYIFTIHVLALLAIRCQM